MTGATPTSAKLSFQDANGGPLANGTLTVYLAGTTTPTPTWQDLALAVLNTNPIVLDARGECTVFLDNSLTYKFLLEDAGGATIWTADNIIPVSSVATLQTQVDELVVKQDREVYIDDFGENTVPGLTDMTAALNAAIAAVGSGGTVRGLDAQYLLTSEIAIPSGTISLKLKGTSSGNGGSGTRFIGKHTGRSILSLVNTNFVTVEDIQIVGDITDRPKCGLLLGISSGSINFGNHTVTNVGVRGRYSVAGVCNMGSSRNVFMSCAIVPDAAPIAGVYMCQEDGVAVSLGSLIPGNVLMNTFIGGTIGNNDTTAGTTALYIDAGANIGNLTWVGTTFTKDAGDSYVRIRIGEIGESTYLPIEFQNCSTAANGGTVRRGLEIIPESGSWNLYGLRSTMSFDATTEHSIFTDSGGLLTLIDPCIKTPARATTVSPVVLPDADGGSLTLLGVSAVTLGNLSGCDVMTDVTPTISSLTGGGNTVRRTDGSVNQISPLTAPLGLANTTIIKSVTGDLAIDGLRNVYYVSIDFPADFVVSNPSNRLGGQQLTFIFKNNTASTRTVVFSTDFIDSGGLGITAGFTRSVTFVWIPLSVSKWFEVARTIEYT